MSNYFSGGDDIDVWHQKRKAKFTSSCNYKLLGDGKVNSTYVEEKVIELTTRYYERPELEQVESLLWGNVYERPAFETYVDVTKNHSMIYIGRDNPIFYPDETMIYEAGGSPDGADINEGKITHGLEIKCPKNPAYHFRRLNWKTMWDVKDGYPQCYCQIQDLIRVTRAASWDFISYDERQLSKQKRIVIIEIKPDTKFINNLEIRIRNAVTEKYKLLSKYYGVELKNKTDFINFINQ
jgi:hypothetical protein